MNLAVANRALLEQTGGDPRRVVFGAKSRMPPQAGDHVEEFEILFAPPDRWHVTFLSPPGRIRSTQVRDRETWWLDQSSPSPLGDPPATFPFMDFFRGSHLLGEMVHREPSLTGRGEGVVTYELRAGPAELPGGLTIPGADSAVVGIRSDRDVIVAVKGRVHGRDAYQIEMSELDFDLPVDDVAFRAGVL